MSESHFGARASKKPLRLRFFAVHHLLLLRELRVEDDLARREVEALHEAAGFGRAEFAVHAAVFPFHAEWTGVGDVIQRADDALELDIAAAYRLEVPVAVRLVEVHMAAKDAGVVREIPGHVLH